MKQKINILILLFIVIMGCSKKEQKQAKNLTQIHKENGVPVKTKIIEPEQVSIELPFTATLSGIRQSHVAAMMGGRIEKIHVNQGDYVEKDQILIEFPEDTPGGQYFQAKSAFELASSTYKKMEEVYRSGGISSLEFEQVQTQYNVSKANFDTVSQMLKLRAPISGYVTSLPVKETDNVKAENILATISQTKKLKAKVWITDEEISQIKIGQKASTTWNNHKLEGVVTSVSLAIDPTKNAFGVDVEFDNHENQIRAGVISNILIQSYENDNSYMVRRKNVLNDENGEFVYISKNEKAVKTYVQTENHGKVLEIVSGVEQGDKIITSSLNQVFDGAKIKEV